MNFRSFVPLAGQKELVRANGDRYKTFIAQRPLAVVKLNRYLNFKAASRKYMKDYHLALTPINGLIIHAVFPEIDNKWKRTYQAASKGKVLNGVEQTYQRVGVSVYHSRALI